MYRRWAYMALAILATWMITLHPVLSFHEDKGIYYTRSFSMDLQQVVVLQTSLDSLDPEMKEVLPKQEVVNTISVYGLYLLQKLIFWTCIVCFIIFYPTRVRWYLSFVIMALAGVFYVLLVYYALRISDMEFATLAPTWSAFMPAVVIAMMVLLNRNVIQYGNYFDDIKVD